MRKCDLDLDPDCLDVFNDHTFEAYTNVLTFKNMVIDEYIARAITTYFYFCEYGFTRDLESLKRTIMTGMYEDRESWKSRWKTLVFENCVFDSEDSYPKIVFTGNTKFEKIVFKYCEIVKLELGCDEFHIENANVDCLAFYKTKGVLNLKNFNTLQRAVSSSGPRAYSYSYNDNFEFLAVRSNISIVLDNSNPTEELLAMGCMSIGTRNAT